MSLALDATFQFPHIVLVEDDPDNRLLVEALLLDRYSLEQYENGPDALAGIKKSPPDLVLLDISLPGMSGTEVLASLRADPALARIPVVALTAHGMTKDGRDFLSQGFDDHIIKPILDENELYECIDRLLGLPPRLVKSGVAPLVHSGNPHVPHREPVFATGEVLNYTYEILSLIGSGGMGEVYDARDLMLNRVVAVKASLPHVSDEALLDEARVLAPFRHSGLVTVHSFGCHRGIFYLVMEKLFGLTLAEHLARRGSTAFSVSEALDVMIEIGDTLAVLHAAGLAHRDIKPENVMLAARGRVVLLDCGIVRHERHISGERTVSGSPLYMAPETITVTVLTGEAHLVDLYALGSLSFELLTGRPLFSGDTTSAILQHQLHTVPPHIREFRPELPPELDALVFEMLAKRPEDRPPTIEVVNAALRVMRSALGQTLFAPLSVLIVDDDSDMQDLIAALVRKTAPLADIRIASDGAEALRLFQKRPPELLFLDLQMPVMNGAEVCMFLRGTHLADRTTIVVMSAFADENQALLAQLGIADVIAKKDRGPHELAMKIKSLVQRVDVSRARPPSARPLPHAA